MTTREEAAEAVRRSLKLKEDRIQWQPGFMGDGNGAVATSRANYYWVRYPYSNSPAVPVYGVANFSAVENVQVIVGYLPWQPGQFQIICQADGRADTLSPSDTIIHPGDTIGYVPLINHAINHMYLGVDPVYVNWRQITPLGVFPTNPPSLSVTVKQGYIPRPGTDVFVSEQDVDLTASVPGSGARYVLISFDNTGTVVVTDGTINSGGFLALTVADIPDTPAGNWRSCAVVLYVGQTAIVENRTEIDFYDLRFPEEFIAGSLALTENHIFVGDASNIAADVALSNDATIVASGALTLATVNANVGTFGDATNVAQVTVNAKGLVTAVVDVPITGLLSNGSEQYQVLTTGATPFAPVYSNYLLDGTSGGKTILAVTNTKTLTLTVTDDYNLTIPATGTAVLGTGTLGRIATWGGTNTLGASNLIKTGAGTLTLSAPDAVTNTYHTTPTNGRPGMSLSDGTHTLGYFAATGTDSTLTVSGDVTLTAAGTYNLTIPATGTAVLGTGINTRVAVWSGTNTLTNSNLILSVAAPSTLYMPSSFGLNTIVASTPSFTVLDSAGNTKTSLWLKTALDNYGFIDIVNGKTLTVAETGTAALGAGTLTVATTNDVTGATHTHAITSSANPGTAASLLASDASGNLRLQNLTLDAALSFGTFIDMPSIANPAAPAAGHVRFHASTTQGFTRFEQDNEATTNLVLGRDNVFICKNTSGGNIAAGKPVYVTGSTGNVPNIALAKADSLTTLPVIGITLDAINDNNFGQVMNLGVISNIDTSAFSTGAQLWVSPITAGALVSTRPVYPNYVARIGSVLVSGVGNGSLLIEIAPFIGGEESGTTLATWTAAGVINLAGTSNQIVMQSAGVTGTLTWTPASSNKVITLPNLTGTVALGADTLTVSTANSVTVASHTHAITSSASPGAAASLLATDASGSLTLGSSAVQGFTLQPVSANAGSNVYGLVSLPSANNTTGEVDALYARPQTTAAAFTLSYAIGLHVANPTKGAGSTIVEARGIWIEDITAGGTVNYAIYVTGGKSYFGGFLGVGVAPVATAGINLAPTAAASGASVYGLYNNLTVSGTTTEADGLYTKVTTAASAFTLGAAVGLHIGNPSAGATSTITTAYGLIIDNQTAGATNYAMLIGTGLVNFADTTESTASNTGAVVVSGGVGIAKKLHVGGGFRVGGDGGGAASTTGVTNVTNTTVTNTYLVKGGQAANTVNTGWIKIYIGTNAAWIPYWQNATP